MGLFGKSAEQRRNERRINESKNTLYRSREQYGDTREDLSDRASYLMERGQMSVGDRFGDTISRAEDQINDRNASNSRVIARAIAAGGGDLTGGANVLANKNVESGNKELASLNSGLAVQNENINQGYENASTSVLSRGASLDANKMMMDKRSYDDSVLMELQRKQANKQFWSDLAGTVLGTGGQILSAGLLRGE